MVVKVKICGLKTLEAVDVSCESGASMCGFVFFPKSPRSIKFDIASELTKRVPPNIAKVGLVVDANDSWLENVVLSGVDWLQFHGHESPKRIIEIKTRWKLPIIKAIPISNKTDLNLAKDYDEVADLLLFDAKPESNATRPGGNAMVFDWQLLKGSFWKCPWILAGGLNNNNLEDAVHATGALFVDVSSGVEDTHGNKNNNKISTFLTVAKNIGEN